MPGRSLTPLHLEQTRLAYLHQHGRDKYTAFVALLRRPGLRAQRPTRYGEEIQQPAEEVLGEGKEVRSVARWGWVNVLGEKLDTFESKWRKWASEM